ncbi:hypothetical protein [Rhodospira trueperi]|uniref:Uncharacterized protein n=1 Tax=Rhodospira trueperi TaxID=69960 RepID=A0A1G7E3H8_9PROT|nr:hypothetical protein [Rhodospira trueperi]SDE58026.1 hypothetical protein SAMN05421720_108147 [Rhodospira trueperi]
MGNLTFGLHANPAAHMLGAGAVCALMLGGCSQITDYYTNDPVTNHGQRTLSRYGEVLPFNTDTDCLAEYSISLGAEQCTIGHILANAKHDAEKAVFRNALMDELILLSDSNCIRHQAAILHVTSVVDATTTTISGVLAGVSAIVTGSLASQVMATTASGITLAQSTANEKIMFNFLAPAVLQKIIEERNEKLDGILDKRGETFDQYSVRAMIRDVEEYNRMCSFYYGIQRLAYDTKDPENFTSIQVRIDELTTQYNANNERMDGLKGYSDTVRAQRYQLELANTTILQEITALQRKLVAAPRTVPPPSPSESTPDEGS